MRVRFAGEAAVARARDAAAGFADDAVGFAAGSATCSDFGASSSASVLIGFFGFAALLGLLGLGFAAFVALRTRVAVRRAVEAAAMHTDLLEI